MKTVITKIIQAQNLYKTNKYTFQQIADILSITKSTAIHYCLNAKYLKK